MTRRQPAQTLIGLVALGLAATMAFAGPTAGVLDSLTQFQDYEARRESSSNADITRNGDARSIDVGETLVLADIEGPGVITHIWSTVGSIDPFHGRSLVLRFYWDGAEHPSVQAPLGDFFGVGHGALAEFGSVPVSVTSYGRSRACFWRMPFRQHAKVTVTNESDTFPCDSFYYYLDWQKHDRLPEDTAYFHAQYRQEMPAQPGNYTLLETTGRGHYVGTVYSAHQVELGWFGEGDDFFYIDGEEMPSLRGTGTEDYFNDAWGFRPFSRPYYGVPLYEGVFPGDRLTAYRWHLEDPIPFKESLKATIEHRGSVFTEQAQQLGGFIERPDWVSSVAFWYQYPPATLNEPLPPASKRVAPHRMLTPDDLEISAKPDALLIKEKYSVVYSPGTPDAAIDFSFSVEKAGRYVITAALYHSVLGSLYQPLIDGEPLGPALDLWILNADAVWVRFDAHDLEPGKHTLRFEGRGPSPQRRANVPLFHAIGLYALVLEHLEDMTGYHQKLNELTK